MKQFYVQDEIKLFLSDETIGQFSEAVSVPETEADLDVIYEDKHILIVNKPLGSLSQKAKKDDISMVELIISYLLKKNEITRQQLASFTPAVCNRLDRNTSGLLIAGKSLSGLQEMARLLRNRNLSKYYLCIVKGDVTEKKSIEGYLTKDEEKNIVTIHPEQTDASDYIRTEYEPLAYSKNLKGSYTLLQVKLITGRSHQIRAHLASIGHPLIGDYKYGDQKTNHFFKMNYGLNHQLLHSSRMVFPKLDGELSYLSDKEFTAEIPEIFEKIRAALFD